MSDRRESATGLELYAHPFSSYCWKVLIALWEMDVPFAYRRIDDRDPDEPENAAALMRFWPLGKFPVLVDAGRAIPESSVIIEHVQLHHAAETRLVPADPTQALEVRLLDRIFDNHLMSPVQAIVAEHLPFLTDTPNEKRVARSRGALDTIYAWLEEQLAGRTWAAGESFTMADCAGAPALFYADWVHSIPEQFRTLHGYRERLLARPSVARAVDEARPFRHLFPLGAPDRD